MPTTSCDLCGLPARGNAQTATWGDRTRHFCCVGCRMVFSMLMEAADTPDPAHFRETELYRRCVAAGVVPASEEDPERPAVPAAAGGRSETAPVPEALDVQRRITGMWCPACAWVIEAALLRTPGVIEAACDFSTDRLRCRYDPVRIDPRDIARTVEKLGYGAVEPEARDASGDGRRAFVRLAVCAILSMNVMMISWAVYSGFFTTLSLQDRRFLTWPVFLLATVVVAYGGGPLMRKAWSGLRAGAPGMEVLIVAGSGSAYLYSLLNMLRGSLHIYFDTAAMLITLLLLGKQLEQHAKERVRRDLEAFLSLQPRKVRLIRPEFPEGRFTAIEQLGVGDHFSVKAHETVPADGRVFAGEAQVDLSAVTGEPRPVRVAAGERLISGSRILEGALRVQAERIGADSMLGQMIGVVSGSLGRKTAFESRTERTLALFVPLLIGIAAMTGILGLALGLSVDAAVVRMVTVLVIACPCALGIAIPLARVAGISTAARQGLLVRNFDAFERAGRIDTLVFDKTGTLTHGRWRLEQIITAEGLAGHEALALAGGLEAQSDHAVARALRAAAEGQGVAPKEIEAVVEHALGVSGHFGGRVLRLGRLDFACPNEPPQGVLPAPGQAGGPLSYVYLSSRGEPCAAFGFGDAMRPGIAPFIRELKQDGFEVHIISGDTHEAVQALARHLEVEHAAGGLLPTLKAEYIDRLRGTGRRVMMMGDGLNDAAALACADLSLAVHTGTPLAREAADVTLMRGDPLQWSLFLLLSRRINRAVHQNLWCAAGYNLISIPLAMGGLLNPLIAATAMLFSSLTVIGNTLRLVRTRPAGGALAEAALPAVVPSPPG